MPCTFVTIPGGIRAIVCTRGPRPRCACGRLATLQCDAPAKRRSGTCDRHICAASNMLPPAETATEQRMSSVVDVPHLGRVRITYRVSPQK